MSDKVISNPVMPNGFASDGSGFNWDLDALRLNQSFDGIVGAESVLTNVAVRKPGGQEWFRVHPEWRLQTTILQLKDQGESYLIAPGLRKDLWDEILPMVLFTAVSLQGEPFIWPVRLPKVEGRSDKFIQTDLAAAKLAETKWARRSWVWETKSHKVAASENISDIPVWPDIGFEELLKVAFKDRYITELNHPVIKSLRGEV